MIAMIRHASVRLYGANPEKLDSHQGVENGYAYCFSSPNSRAIVLAHGPPWS
jgi:hypothetical protein